MNYENMWNELKEFFQKTKKITEQINTKGILEIIDEIENTEIYKQKRRFTILGGKYGIDRNNN